MELLVHGDALGLVDSARGWVNVMAEYEEVCVDQLRKGDRVKLDRSRALTVTVEADPVPLTDKGLFLVPVSDGPDPRPPLNRSVLWSMVLPGHHLVWREMEEPAPEAPEAPEPSDNAERRIGSLVKKLDKATARYEQLARAVFGDISEVDLDTTIRVLQRYRSFLESSSETKEWLRFHHINDQEAYD